MLFYVLAMISSVYSKNYVLENVIKLRDGNLIMEGIEEYCEGIGQKLNKRPNYRMDEQLRERLETYYYHDKKKWISDTSIYETKFPNGMLYPKVGNNLAKEAYETQKLRQYYGHGNECKQVFDGAGATCMMYRSHLWTTAFAVACAFCNRDSPTDCKGRYHLTFAY